MTTNTDNQQKVSTWVQQIYCHNCHATTPHKIYAYPAGTVKVCQVCGARGKP